MIEVTQVDALSKIKDLSLTKAAFYALLEVDNEDGMIAKLSQMPEEESLKWQKKLNFTDFAFLKAKFGGIAYENRKAAERAAGGGGNFLEDLLGSLDGAAGAVGLAGAVGAAEVTQRITELLNGSEQTYFANLSVEDLHAAFEISLQNAKISIDLERDNGESGTFIFTDSDSEEELLRINVANSAVEADIKQRVYNESEVRMVGRCLVSMTGSNMEKLLAEGGQAAFEVKDIVDAIGRGGDLQKMLRLAMLGATKVKEVFDVAKLPKTLVSVIEKVAKDAEGKENRTTTINHETNTLGFKEVASYFVCAFCGKERKSGEEQCSKCGGNLSPRDENDMRKMSQDREKLAKLGYTISS